MRKQIFFITSILFVVAGLFSVNPINAEVNGFNTAITAPVWMNETTSGYDAEVCIIINRKSIQDESGIFYWTGEYRINCFGSPTFEADVIGISASRWLVISEPEVGFLITPSNGTVTGTFQLPHTTQPSGCHYLGRASDSNPMGTLNLSISGLSNGSAGGTRHFTTRITVLDGRAVSGQQQVENPQVILELDDYESHLYENPPF